MIKYILLVLTLVLNTSFSTVKAKASDTYLKKLSEEATNGNEQAMNILVTKAKQGNTDAQYFVAQIVLGDGNYEDGIRWYQLAAEQGHSMAQASLGGISLNREENYEEAYKWFKLSAEQGNAWGQLMLGGMYSDESKGVPKDDILNYKWWYLASLQHLPPAIMGLEILSKEMTPENIKKAEKLAKDWKPQNWEKLKKTKIWEELKKILSEKDDEHSQENTKTEDITTGTPEHFIKTTMDRVFFDFEKHSLDERAKKYLENQVKWLLEYKEKNIVIEGHCDKRESLELSELRAKTVEDFMISLGVNSSRIKTIAYGNSRPAVRGDDEASFAQNRRAVTIIAR